MREKKHGICKSRCCCNIISYEPWKFKYSRFENHFFLCLHEIHPFFIIFNDHSIFTDDHYHHHYHHYNYFSINFHFLFYYFDWWNGQLNENFGWIFFPEKNDSFFSCTCLFNHHIFTIASMNKLNTQYGD